MVAIQWTFKLLLGKNLAKIVHILCKVNYSENIFYLLNFWTQVKTNRKITLNPQSYRHNVAHSHLEKLYSLSLGSLHQAITPHNPGSLEQTLHWLPFLQETSSQSKNIYNHIWKNKCYILLGINHIYNTKIF